MAENSKRIGVLANYFTYPLRENNIGKSRGYVTFIIQPLYDKGSIQDNCIYNNNKKNNNNNIEKIRGTLYEKRVIRWIIDLCEGLDYLHSNDIVHRNIQYVILIIFIIIILYLCSK